MNDFSGIFSNIDFNSKKIIKIDSNGKFYLEFIVFKCGGNYFNGHFFEKIVNRQNRKNKIIQLSLSSVYILALCIRQAILNFCIS